MWFETKVELDEATEAVKTVFCTQLGQAELSQIMLYNIEINTEADIERDDYKISILYDEDDPKASTLNRILEKAPHYSIKYVDPTIARIQRSFSFDGSSVCDAFDNIEEEIGCLVDYESGSDKNGMPLREISIYDLQQNCNDCGHRGEFIDECPKCGSKNIKNGYGEDTLIFVTADELASEGIQLVTDTDSVKNCFKLEGGDDLMTATIRNCNPNGTDYIWYFSDDTKEDMSDELVQKIENYDKEYKESYKNKAYNLDTNLLSSYNALVAKYDDYYNTKSTCLNCKHEDKFYDKCPQCGSENLLLGDELQSISSPITGYSALMNAYYNTIDLALYLKSGLMPNVEMSDTTASNELAKLTIGSLSPVAVENIDTISKTTANAAVLSMAKIIVKSTYKVEIKNSDNVSWTNNADGTKTWSGGFIITNYSDENDRAETEDGKAISVVINGDKQAFIEQKVKKALNKENTDDLSISGLFEKEYDEFCDEIKKYALNPLKSFAEACDTCLSVLTEQGAGDKNEKSDLYNDLYKPYYDKSVAIASEIKTRENEIAIIEGVYNEDENGNKVLATKGLQTDIEEQKQTTQDTLDFEKYLGEKLWLEFCLYRREDKYTNDNYISDGLNNAELFKKALEFIDVAENEIYKSSELQHSISTSLNNLLVIPKFKPLVKSFKNGNWIRVQVDDKVYKLRLIEYGLGYSDLNNIPVEFSDLTKIKNSTTDVQDVISQASSIATSYDTIKRQSNKGNIAKGTIEQWLEDGLNTAHTQIQNNNNEELIITKNGLLGRSYSDITGGYDSEQFKLTHNMFAYTSDGWETVSTALGKHDYKYWNGTNFVDDTDYGLSTKFVTAGYITGSQVIGGEIVSSNYVPSGDNRKGTHIDLLEGSFDFAGGRMIYDGDDTLTLKDVKIDWTTTTAPEMTDISGLGEYKNKLDSLGFEKTTGISETYMISPAIGGGYLNIRHFKNGSGVIIDPNNLTGTGNIFQILNNDGQTTITTDANGNAVFNGKIDGGSLLIGKKGEADAAYAEITEDGILTANGAKIIGTIVADNGNIGGFEITENAIFNRTNSLESTLDGIYIGTDGIRLCGAETVDEETGETCADFIHMQNGILTAIGADITGHINANTGSIGGWEIDGEYIKSIYSEEYGVGLYSGDEENICSTSSSPIRFYAGSDEPVNAPFYITANGFVKAENANIAGWTIDNETISKGDVGMSSGSIPYPSLVDPSTTSPIRFYSGGLGNKKETSQYIVTKEYTVPSDMVGQTFNEIFSLDENEKNLYRITKVECKSNPTMVTATDTVTSEEITIEINELPTTIFPGQSVRYSGSQTITLFPEETTNVIGQLVWNRTSGISSTPTLKYMDGGQVKVSYTNVSVTPTQAVGTITGTYEIDETAYVTTTISEDEKSFDVSFTPLTNNEYTLTVEYTLMPVAINFALLDDGSLYAENAKISGTINATDGVFNGTVYANEGKIGGLKFSESSISSDDNSDNPQIIIQPNGAAFIKNLNVTESFECDTVQIKEICGKGDSLTVPRLDFASGSPITEEVQISCSFIRNNEGSTNFWTGNITDAGSVTVTVNADKTLNETIKLIVSVEYVLGNSTVVINPPTKKFDVVLSKGQQTISFDTVNLIDDDNGHTCSCFNVVCSPSTIQQLTGSSEKVITSNVSIVPKTTELQLNLGSDTKFWHTIYAKTSSINTSDANVKNTILPLTQKHTDIFDALKPVSYKFNDSSNGRTHIGLIAQDVKEAVESVGLTTQDFAGYCEWEDTDGGISCGLRYSEFISMCIYEIQKLKKRVNELESKM